MKMQIGRRVGVALVAIGLVSTLSVLPAGASATITGDLTFSSTDGAAALTPAAGGSSFDFPFFSQAIQTFETQSGNLSGANAPSAIPSYSSVGSTAGKKGVIAGTFAIGASDVPMGTVVNGVNLDSSLLTNADPAHTLNSYVQIPVVLGGEGMMYNLPMLNAKYKKYPVVMSSAIIADIFDGKITTWNNSAICKLNPNIAVVKKNKKGKVVSRKCALPNLTITPVFRADGSGTSYIFSDYLHTTSGANYETPSGTEVWPSTTFNQGQLPSERPRRRRQPRRRDRRHLQGRSHRLRRVRVRPDRPGDRGQGLHGTGDQLKGQARLDQPDERRGGRRGLLLHPAERRFQRPGQQLLDREWQHGGVLPDRRVQLGHRSPGLVQPRNRRFGAGA